MLVVVVVSKEDCVCVCVAHAQWLWQGSFLLVNLPLNSYMT